MRINGAGIDIVFRRTYKNQVAYYGPLGINWTHNYNMYLHQGDTELVLTTGDLKEETYTRHPRFGEANFTYFVPPDGQDAVFLPSGDSFVRRAPDGLRHIFQRDPDSTDGHRLSRIEDRYGNFLQLGYNIDGQLDTILVNHPNRVIRFQYDSIGHMIAVSDYTGRIWCYEYDGSDDLITVTSPPTDRYPAGLTTQYEYSTPYTSGLLQHNLVRILDPAGRNYLENAYGDIVDDISFNRVVRQRQGGGEALFEYQIVDQVFEHDYTDAQRPAFQTNFVDRNGHPIHFVYNKFGNLILKEEQVLDGDNLRLLAWRYRYNRDGNLIASLSPERVLTQYYFGRDDYLRKYGITDDEVATHDQLTIQERLAFGRLLAVVRRGKRYLLSSLNLAVGVWGDIFPDVLGGVDPEDLVTKFTYEPDYNQPLTVSDPRFTERADPNFAELPIYYATLTQYEYVGPKNNPPSDPHRFLARVKRPDPTWPDGTKPGPIVQQFTDYDDHGRLLQQIDPAGTVTLFT